MAPGASDGVAARLDRLPMSRFHRRFLALISLGAWFDYYDNFVASSLAVILVAAGVLRHTQAGDWISEVGLFSAALPLGMFLGTIFLGMASDVLGRRFGFIAMLLLYSLATFVGGAGYYPVVAAAGASAGFVLLLVTRALAGAGVGAENVIIDAYVSEMMPRQTRGWAVAVTHAIAFTAWPVATFLPLLLAPKGAPEGWWLLLVLGSLGALLAWYLRRGMAESPRWLAAVGRGPEAEAALAQIEATVERETGKPLPPPAPSAPSKPRAATHPWRAIWSPALRRRTLLLMAFQLLQTVGYYGFAHWLATLLIAKGFDQDEALTMQFAASLLAPVGPLLAIWSIERWQRKWLIVILSAALAGLQMAFGVADHPVVLIAVAAAVVLGSNWFSAVFHAYQAELFPTEARGTGVGFTYAWSRASMMALMVLMPGLIATNLPAAFALTACAFLGVAALIGLFGPLTNARPLEAIARGVEEGTPDQVPGPGEVPRSLQAAPQGAERDAGTSAPRGLRKLP
jgi:MFS transporter, putative metabolite:H+ symporter